MKNASDTDDDAPISGPLSKKAKLVAAAEGPTAAVAKGNAISDERDPPSVSPGGGSKASSAKDSKSTSKASASSPKAAPSKRPAKQRIQGSGTYPTPNNFAERLMHVLENETDIDSIYWLGEGESIAVHMKNIKKSPVLDTHFQGNRYSSFIRNLNRWGFRRVSYYSTPETVVAFHNSLFQKKKPHLVKHMKMDSDVQDIFERHQLNSDLQQAQAAAAAPKDGQSSEGGEPPVENQDAKMSAAGGDAVAHALLGRAQQQQMGLSHIGGQHHQQLPLEISFQDRMTAMYSMQQGQQQQQQQQQASQKYQLQAALAASLQAQMEQQQRPSPPVSAADSAGSSLENLVRGVQQYLDNAPPPDTSVKTTIKTLLELFVAVALEEVESKQLHRSSSGAEIGGAATQLQQIQQMLQMQQHQPQQRSNSDLLQHLLRQKQLGTDHQQQPDPAGRAANSAVTYSSTALQQMLLQQQGGRGDATTGSDASSQQQPAPQLLQQLLSSSMVGRDDRASPGLASSGAGGQPSLQQVLLMLQQQQQH